MQSKPKPNKISSQTTHRKSNFDVSRSRLRREDVVVLVVVIHVVVHLSSLEATLAPVWGEWVFFSVEITPLCVPEGVTSITCITCL